MLHILPYTPDWRHDPALCAMFSARKRVFIDLLKWELPVTEDTYEIDRFDAPGAIYLVLTGPGGRHLASARLLQTDRPHLLDSLFRNLCAKAPPAGPAVREITRFCLDRHLRTVDRRRARNDLVSALIDYALAFKVTTYTGVAEAAWFQQIMDFGWHCRALGSPQVMNSGTLVGLRIDIAASTPDLLAETGIYTGAQASREIRHAA